MKPTLVSRCSASSQFRWRNVFFVLGHGAGPAEFDASMQQLRDMAQQVGKVALVVAVQVGRSQMTNEERKKMQESTRKIEPLLACQVTLIKGTGFFASAMLAAAASIMSVLRPSYPKLMSRDEAEVAAWLLPHVSAHGGPATVAQVREALDYVMKHPTENRGFAA